MLKLADNLGLPLNAITDTFAILAIRGAGKSHTASVMAEEMLKAGQPIVAYDPTGAWWGLKSSADGKAPGFPVVVFGGEHADVPLEETAGDTIASTIIEQRIPAILDCSLMRKAARVRFMTDFAETLYGFAYQTPRRRHSVGKRCFCPPNSFSCSRGSRLVVCLAGSHRERHQCRLLQPAKAVGNSTNLWKRTLAE